MDAPRIRPLAMDDNNLPSDEEGKGICETDDMTYCRAGQLATGCMQGSPLTSTGILAPS